VTMADVAQVSPQVVAKPTGWLCNLACEYCFYLEKKDLYPDESHWAMSETVLDAYIRQFIEAQDGPVATFVWQGGEPTLLGIDFFRRAVALQHQYAGNKRVENAFQTNGVLLDDAWCEFLRENDFLVGISIDGPREVHDRYRTNASGVGSFDQVMRAIDLLQRRNVEFNTLTTVHRANERYPREVYRFLKSIGSHYLQFIPIVEKAKQVHAGLRVISGYSVQPRQYGEFLCTIFDEWVRHDVGTVFVQLFETALQVWCGHESSLCIFGETCGSALALEHNGDLYSCDHFVYPENHLGNILESPLRVLTQDRRQRAFGDAKRDDLPQQCRECDVLFACRGECPKNRVAFTASGESRLNYLCEAYQRFFRHVDPAMRFMTSELRNRRSPTSVMEWARARDEARIMTEKPGRNGLCVCGSGQKFKKCCGR
jgi:uncharacterized protein